MSDIPTSNGDNKEIEVVEVVEVDDKELENVDLELGATLFDVDNVKQRLNTRGKGKVLDGEELLEKLANDSQIIHVKGGKTANDKLTKKTGKSKKNGTSTNKKDKEDKDAR